MGMLVAYQKLTKKEIADARDEYVPKIEQWFKDNPRRRVCNFEFVYGKLIKVRRGRAREDVGAVANTLIEQAPDTVGEGPHA